jgi:MFS family permease
LAFALAALVLVFHLSRNSRDHPLSIPCLIGAGVIAIVIAVRRCSVQDLEMLYNRPLLIASIAAILNYAAIYNVTFVLPFYLLDGRKLDPVEIGFILTVRPVITALVAPFSGAIADRYGVGNVSKVGLFIILTGFFLFFEINGQSQTIWIILSLVSVGLGMGLFIAPNHSLIMNVAPFSGKGVASAILSLNRNLGMLIGASLGGAFFLTIRNHQSFDTSSINVSAHIVFSISTLIAGIALILLLITDAFNFLKGNNVIAK